MAQASFGRATDDLFAESIIAAIDEGYKDILVVATTRAFTDALVSFIITEREPEKLVRQPTLLRYSNGQAIRFVGDHSSTRGIQVDRVLIHPLASLDARLSVTPCERPNPIKLT